MSSILKALRKLENEKATLGEGSVDLAHDILKRNYDDRRTFSWSILGTIFTLLVIASVGGWWFYQSSLSVPASLPSASQVEIQTIPRAAPVSSPTEQSAGLKQQPSIPEVVVLETGPSVAAKGEIVEIQNRLAADKKTLSNASVAESEPIDIPLLRVDEIVYHQEAESRLAVINDLPVMEGTDIEGAHVVEIMPDHVLFTFRGIRFNKFLSKVHN